MTKTTDIAARRRSKITGFIARAFMWSVCGAFGCASVAKGADSASGTPGASAASAASAVSSERLDFEFDSLDDRPASSQATRGRPTVIVFVQLGSVWSQAQVSYLVAMQKNDENRVNYLLVALEPRSNRELVELYARTLGVTFVTAFADAATLAGAGPFGDLRGVPATLVLDRAGHVVYRADGRVAKSDELRNHMRGL